MGGVVGRCERARQVGALRDAAPHVGGGCRAAYCPEGGRSTNVASTCQKNSREAAATTAALA